MGGNNKSNFIVGKALATAIESQTGGKGQPFERRDFVEPLVKFCLDGDYSARIGVVYGLRSTGKTVGILQAADELEKQGKKVAYARFGYAESEMDYVNEKINELIAQGYTHFFLDEATYLEGFLNQSAEWADSFVPQHRVKIVVSGTDSFLLLAARATSLFHRCAWFSTSWFSFGEYRRVTGNDYDAYRIRGGKFTSDDMPEYVSSAVVDNLLHTIQMVEDSNRTNYYTERLFGLNRTTLFKAVLAVFKCAVDEYIVEKFAENASAKNIADLGTTLSLLKQETEITKTSDIKERIANSIELYRNFTPVKDPIDVIESLLEFLVKTGCLLECSTAITDFGKQNKSYCFANNALMNYAIDETIIGILNLRQKYSREYEDGVRQAGEGIVNESIVLAHILQTAIKSDSLYDSEHVFKYRDAEQREIDIVAVFRKANVVRLIEVKSAKNLDEDRIFIKAAVHLYDDEILRNIGVDKTFEVTRTIVYRGETKGISHPKGDLKLWNIEDFLCRQEELHKYHVKSRLEALERDAEVATEEREISEKAEREEKAMNKAIREGRLTDFLNMYDGSERQKQERAKSDARVTEKKRNGSARGGDREHS